MALAGVFLALPVLLPRGAPMTDLPLHESIVAVLRHFDDPRWNPGGLYVRRWGAPNQLFYLLSWALSGLMPVVTACRVVVVGSIVGILLAGARLARTFGASPWVALALAPLALGWTTVWGFAPNLLGLALFLAAVPSFDRLCEAPTPGRALAASGALVALAAAHVTSLLAGLIVLAVFVALAPWERGSALGATVQHAAPLRIVPLLVGGLLVFASTRTPPELLTPLTRAFASRVLWHSTGRKLSSLPELLAGPRQVALAAVPVVLSVVTTLVFARSAPARGPVAHASLRARLHDRRLLVAAAALFAAFLLLPYSINFGAYLYARFLAPAAALACVGATSRRGSTRPGAMRLGIALGAASVAAPVLVMTPHALEAHRNAVAVDEVLARVVPGSATMVLQVGNASADAVFSAKTAGHRVVTLRGGRVQSDYMTYPIAPVVVRPELRWDLVALRTFDKAGSMVPAHDLRRFRYLLVRVNDPALAPRLVPSLVPEARLVDARGSWVLFESTLDVGDVASVEGPAAAPGLASWGRRFADVK